MGTKSRYTILNRYISREFLSNFLVAFLFFFCVFFINSILLLVEKILLKNINFLSMLQMVLLLMPQFLVYTFPFATLAASSMVLGNLSSSNELLAIRSCGISSSRIYKPIIIFSIILSAITFIFADVIHPLSSVIYRDKLALLMAEMPTFEIEPNSVNSVGDIVLYNKDASGREIYDLVLVSKNKSDMMQTVISEKGELELIDPNNYIYSLNLSNPTIFLDDADDIESYVYSKAEKATFYLDFSNQIPALTSNSPVNLTSRELLDEIEIRDQIQSEDRRVYYKNIEEQKLNISSNLKSLARGEKSYDSAQDGIKNANRELEYLGSKPVNFTGQYYKAELTKKFALSSACFFLTLITLPLSNIKVKHGKLTGFALSLIVAVAYWYMLFAAQLLIFDITMPPYLLIFAPNLVIFTLAIFALVYFRKAR